MLVRYKRADINMINQRSCRLQPTLLGLTCDVILQNDVMTHTAHSLKLQNDVMLH